MNDTQPADIDARILHRVRALLAKAESTVFPDEAAVFAAKAHELMATHAIDRAMTEAHHGESTVTSIRIVVHAPYVKDKYRLLGAVATPNRCRAILGVDLGGRPFDPHLDLWDELPRGARFATVFGHRGDLDATEMLFTSLLLQATKAITDRGSVTDHWGTNHTRAFRHSFLVGFAHTIRERLDEATERATTSTANDQADILPVLADRLARVDDAVNRTFPHLGTIRTSVSSSAGMEAGLSAGRKADVGLSRIQGQHRSLGTPTTVTSPPGSH